LNTKLLPPDVKVVPYLDRSGLVATTLHTVSRTLLEGMGWVVLVLILFLGSFRSAALATPQGGRGGWIYDGQLFSERSGRGIVTFDHIRLPGIYDQQSHPCIPGRGCQENLSHLPPSQQVAGAAVPGRPHTGRGKLRISDSADSGIWQS